MRIARNVPVENDEFMLFVDDFAKMLDAHDEYIRWVTGIKGEPTWCVCAAPPCALCRASVCMRCALTPHAKTHRTLHLNGSLDRSCPAGRLCDANTGALWNCPTAKYCVNGTAHVCPQNSAVMLGASIAVPGFNPGVYLAPSEHTGTSVQDCKCKRGFVQTVADGPCVSCPPNTFCEGMCFPPPLPLLPLCAAVRHAVLTSWSGAAAGNGAAGVSCEALRTATPCASNSTAFQCSGAFAGCVAVVTSVSVPLPPCRAVATH